MRKIVLPLIIVCLFILSSCDEYQGAQPYDPNTKITVSAMPKIESFAPLTGKTGDTITITGINFIDVKSVSFGGKPAASFDVISSTSIKAVVGAGSAGTVSVTNAKGSKALAGFEYIAPPIVVDNGNLALNKPATSSRPLNAANRPPEARGNDGDLSSAWFADGEVNQWWAVDLGAAKKIDEVVIKWEGAFASGYTIQVSVDNVNFTNVFSTTTGVGGNVTHSFDPIDARYVKLLLTKKGTPWEMTFWELEVYTSVNLALNKPATSSRPLNAANRPPEARGNDGDLSSAWFADGEDNQWWAVDLGAAKEINKVSIKWEGAFASGYAIQVSLDNVTFKTVFSTTIGAGGNVSHSFDAVEARYVKLLLTKKGTPWEMTFWEFEVFD
ncbi:MAG: discoidin domain-containing protein [Prolixibacteraceae bacterium]|nr:discoidin domain-containing protein [Prolixibacteraceae bacterium]